MRIISGTAKGLKLIGPPAKSSFLRPTSDRCREALFSIIGQKVDQGDILDLYAGTGAFGLEALSRGCSSAFFVDNNSASLSLIKKNIGNFCRCIGEGAQQLSISVQKHDLRKRLPPLFHQRGHQRATFDIIFLDPPYDTGLAQHSLENLAEIQLLKDDGLIIVEERAKTILPDKVLELTLYDKRKYGDTGFWFYATHHSINS